MDAFRRSGNTSQVRLTCHRSCFAASRLAVTLIIGFSFLSSVNAALRINEIFPATTSSTLADEDGQPSDWIEIYNPDAQAVNLAGYTITDDPSDTSKWVFPATNLASGRFLVLFASGKNRRSGANLHTNFKLSRAGEYLGLFNPASGPNPVSALTPKYPEQHPGYSYGLNASGAWAYFQTPTPGAANATSSIIEVCQPVHFNLDSGIYTSPVTLILTTPTPGALIRYTTDSTEPSSDNGIAYSGPITISATRTVRAAAMKANALPSEIRSRFYLYNPTAALKSLPVLSLIIDQDDLWGRFGIMGIQGGTYVRIDGSFDSWRRSSSSDYFNPAELGLAWERRTDMELLPWLGEKGFRLSAGMRVHGSDSSRLTYHTDSKVPYNIFFRSDYGD
ncbi:MAG TPA: chitobiase/beta-hexosaminidase C-terminal domain-containing protein, partial [Verrucomicrobiae bacterium]|nr:chitobiase/beta-hexosaminidase C-terminal domain-containing protein [Verrucomicrobiae bacterium]